MFDKLTSLEWLLLKNNSLSSLRPGVLDKLTSLCYLDLKQNGLTCLPFPLSIADLRLDKPKSRYRRCGVFITESGGYTQVSEAARTTNTDTYTVALDAEPTASVTIEVTSGEPGTARVSPATLTLTSTNWNSGQTVTVTGVDDKVSQSNDRSATTSHSATSADSAYDGIDIPSVTVSVVEGAGVRIIKSDDSTGVNETAGTTNTDTYTVALDTEPIASVSISIKVNGPDNPFYNPSSE